jgi:nitroimidazol reductase NimA-like FMN-containing flavoprotein (pyridoxamine 5'-phosphate oxidase superfamily)
MHEPLLKELSFSDAEKRFLAQNEACRIATCKGKIPHVVPVSYLFEGNQFYFATDYGTKKLENLQANPNLALTVDIYGSSGNKAVCVQGRATLIESGPEFERLYETFYAKFDWVRENTWKPGEAPFVRVTPYTKVSWGLD